MIPIEEGTIIHATLRNEDLIPAFAELLAELLARETSDVDPDCRKAHKELCKRVMRAIETDGYFESDDADGDLVAVVDALNEHAPEGLYFGSHPGDGSDFGFWANDDD